MALGWVDLGVGIECDIFRVSGVVLPVVLSGDEELRSGGCEWNEAWRTDRTERGIQRHRM